MRHPEKEIFRRLGDDGLARVLTDLMDRSRLVRLANSCGLKYPGMRTQSQTSDRILSDLIERSAHEEASRKAIYRAIRKEAGAAARKWKLLSPEEKLERVEDDGSISSNGGLGLHLYLTASSDTAEDDRALQKLLARAKRLAAAGPSTPSRSKKVNPSRAQSRLEKRAVELQKKRQHLEGQLAKSRESEKVVKRELLRRGKELEEARAQCERLQRELTAALQRADKSAPKRKAQGTDAESVSQITRAVRRLSSDQKKLADSIERLTESGPAGAPEPAPLSLLAEPLEALRKELASLRRDGDKVHREQDRRIEALLAHMAGLAGPAKKSGRGVGKGPERVGVFIDVQNMYYGARRFKGKLDFDALMNEAVRERRLIQATAYVVESKEIDQTGFIAILQQRAIEVRRKTLRVRSDGSMKGDWDMELALDILDAAPSLDVVVLVSGDGDFTSLVNRVKLMGPRVEVFGFPRHTAKSLLEAADHFQPLNRKFMIYTTSRNKQAKSR